MIYLVTNQERLFKDNEFILISPKEALQRMESWKCYQFDTETNGRNPHLCNLLCAQFGYDQTDERIVIDCSTVDITLFRTFMESRYMIGQNLKFDLQFLYNYNIIPRKVYDIMVVEQMLYLGYPTGMLKPWETDTYYKMGFPGKLSFSLKAIAERYLKVDIDKTVRGEIIWRGLDADVIRYAAGDVTYLQKIMHCQKQVFIQRGCTIGAKLECDVVPAMAYLEWCGIKLSEEKWKEKMQKDQTNLLERKKALDAFVESMSGSLEGFAEETFTYLIESYGGDKRFDIPYDATVVKSSEKSFVSSDSCTYHTVKIIKKFPFCKINLQGDLWEGFDTKPHCTINWDSSKQVIPFVKYLGFKTSVQDKKTGEDKDTVLEKELSVQKGVNDEFLKLYFNYKEASKVCGTYGQGHLDLINPKTGRLHTSFKQIGAATGRMSSGGGRDEDLEKYKKLGRNIKLVNLQQLPHDAETRACFIAEKGNKFVSCDFSAEESRLGADVYDDDEMRKEFTERTGDTHALFAWAVYHDECVQCGCTSALDVKKKASQWRNKVKSVEFAYLFGAAAPTIAKNAGCTVEQAQKYIDDLDKFFAGRTAFVKKGSAFVRKNGYVLISPITGHRVWWWDHKYWLERQASFNSEFWEDFRAKHKGTGDETAIMVRSHFQAASKYDRYALNSPTQGRGSIILKDSLTSLFNWIVDNGYFNKVKICVVVHDEVNCEYPEFLKDFPKILSDIMSTSASKYCKSLPIPACPEVGDYWIH